MFLSCCSSCSPVRRLAGWLAGCSLASAMPVNMAADDDDYETSAAANQRNMIEIACMSAAAPDRFQWQSSSGASKSNIPLEGNLDEFQLVAAVELLDYELCEASQPTGAKRCLRIELVAVGDQLVEVQQAETLAQVPPRARSSHRSLQLINCPKAASRRARSKVESTMQLERVRPVASDSSAFQWLVLHNNLATATSK